MSDGNTKEPVEEGSSDESPGSAEAATADVRVESAEPVDKRHGAGRRGFLAGLVPKLAIVIAVIACLIAGSLWWQYLESYAVLRNDDAYLIASLEEARASLRRLDEEMQVVRSERNADEAEVDALSRDVEVLPAELRALGRRVEALQGGQLGVRDNWLREQAEYYLVLANSELGLGGGISNATAALELADDVLRSMGDPGLADVRAAVASELQNLRAVEIPDLEGHAANLGSLIGRVAQLPMRAASPQNFAAPEEPLEDVEPGLGRLWARTRGAVTNIVRIERQEEPVGRVLTDAERRIVRRQLALELQIARTAVLERRQEAFRASLVAADGILNRDFDLAAQSVIETRRLLAQMMRVEIAPELPDISDSLTLLRAAPGGE